MLKLLVRLFAAVWLLSYLAILGLLLLGVAMLHDSGWGGLVPVDMLARNWFFVLLAPFAMIYAVLVQIGGLGKGLANLLATAYMLLGIAAILAGLAWPRRRRSDA